MSLWIGLFAATWCLYAVLAALSARTSRLDAVAVLIAVAAPTLAFFTRSAVEGTSTLGALRGATLVPLLILVVTAGKPARVFDPPGMKARTRRRLPRREREAVDRRDRASARSQLALILCGLAAVIAYLASGATFLN